MKIIAPTTPEEFILTDGSHLQFDRYTLTDPGKELAPVPLAPVGTAREAVDFYTGERERLLNTLDPKLQCLLPFSCNVALMEAFSNNAPHSTEFWGWREHFTQIGTHPLARLLETYSRLRQNLTISKDEMNAHIVSAGSSDSVVAPAPWSWGRHLMDSGSLRLEVRDTDTGVLRSIASEIVDRFGNVTLREALTPTNRTLPNYVGQYRLGVGGTIHTARDNKLTVLRRAKTVNVNTGIVYSAGGGVSYVTCPKDVARVQHLHPRIRAELMAVPPEEWNLFHMLLLAIAQETFEEIGDGDFTYEPVGCGSELPRQGSPEFSYRICHPGTVEDVLEMIARNPHPDCAEHNGFAYAVDINDLPRMLRDPKGTNIIQHKGMFTIYYIAKRLGLF